MTPRSNLSEEPTWDISMTDFLEVVPASALPASKHPIHSVGINCTMESVATRAYEGMQQSMCT